MKNFDTNSLINKLKDLIIEANTVLRPDIVKALREALASENNTNGRKALEMLLENAAIAKNEGKPICQDTGYVDVYFQWPKDLAIRNDLNEIVNEAVKKAYGEQEFRNSIVSDPLFERQNTGDNTPANINIEPSEDDSLKIRVLVKGAGSDNSSAVFMLNPSNTGNDLVKTVVNQVKSHGAKSCPPLVIGIGIGLTFDRVASLSKKALWRAVGRPNDDERYSALEKEILENVNKLGIGPSGLGGKNTALAVHIEQAPCHMATLPVAVNLNCYALRTAESKIMLPI